MNQIVAFNASTKLTMSSQEIAELVESRHDNVKESIKRLAERGVITLPAMKEVSNTGPGPKTVKAYMVEKRDSYVVVAQLSPEFTARLVDRWMELEANYQPAAPSSDVSTLIAEMHEKIVAPLVKIVADLVAVNYPPRKEDR